MLAQDKAGVPEYQYVFMCYRERCYNQSRTGSQIFIAVNVSGQSHFGNTVVLVQVPNVAQLPLPFKVIPVIHLK